MQSVIRVNLERLPYDIAIAPGSLDQLGELIAPLKLGEKVLVVSNPEIFNYYGERAIAALQRGGFEVACCTLPAGEPHKTLETLQTVYDTALEHRLERSSTMVALGGGIVGDMTGFAAASWLRGINVVQVPTTLLAMVDASIGGKTGVNHPRGKNLIGAFHQPRKVIIDPLVLKTLPEREFRAGMAEVIKYGVIWDAELFGRLEGAERLDKMELIEPSLLQEIVQRSCQSKAEVVGKDEKELGLRAILNYGHTIGHAVESLTGYTAVLHGEAVGIGMVAASRIGVKLGLWDEDCDRRQLSLIEKAGLPTKLLTGLNIDEILASLQTDKKVQNKKVRFILPTAIGVVTITDAVPSEVIREVLEGMF